MARPETGNPRMFQKPPYDGFHPDILGQPLHPRPHPTNTAHHKADFHARLTCCIKRVDQIRFDQAVDLGPDFCRPPGAGVFCLGGNQLQQPRLERDRRDRKIFQLLRLHIARGN